jgi:galactokinase
MLEKSRRLFESHFGEGPTVAARAPGRVNLIGEHTDYNGGYVLPVAMKESIYLTACLSEAPEIHIHASDLNASGTIDVEETLVSEHSAWLAYPRGVIRVLRKEGVTIPRLDIMIASDLPVGTGVSSSAALTVAFLNLFLFLGRRTLTNIRIAEFAQRVENEFAGVRCGIMDPLASQACIRDHALWIDCGSLKTQYIHVNFPDHTLLLFNTGIKRRLEESAYNEIRNECDEAARILAVPNLSQMTTESLEEQRGLLNENLYRRTRHVVEENLRVMNAGQALQQSSPQTLGRLLIESHESLRDLYRVSCKELDLMVDIASKTPGWCGGRMVGAGFGGCTVHLVEREKVKEFIRIVAATYESVTGIDPEYFEVIPSDGATCWFLS